METVWLVWRGKPTERELTDVCTDEKSAEAAADEQIRWITRYHSGFDLEWRDLPLPLGDEPTRVVASSQFMEQVVIERRSVRALLDYQCRSEVESASWT